MADDIGTLYILANQDQSLAKVGLTRNSTPDSRADDYSRQHGIRWHQYWSELTLNVGEVEARVHQQLAECRFSHVPGAREIFHITPEKAQRVAARHVIALKTGEQLEAERALAARVQATEQERIRATEREQAFQKRQMEQSAGSAFGSSKRLIGIGAALVLLLYGGLHLSSPNSASSAPVPAPPISAPTIGVSTAFTRGRGDRQAWEAWFAATAGDYRQGALYWAGQRSMSKPGLCEALATEAAKAGCRDAKVQLDPSDVRRRAEPEYRSGWNSL
jgi:hypothetical protein